MSFNIINIIKKKLLGETIDDKKKKLSLLKSKIKEDFFQHVQNTVYFEHKALMKEIIYLLHYTFLVLEEDYYKGDRVFLEGITNLDDYIFSRYKYHPILKDNIKKLNLIAFSNRFEEIPKNNFLSYFVFIEEMNFELIEMLEQYYNMMSNKKQLNKKHNVQLLMRNNIQHTISKNTNILYTEKITNVMVYNKVQEYILNEVLDQKEEK